MLSLVKSGPNIYLVVAVSLLGMTLGASVDFILGKHGLQLIPFFKKEEKSKGLKRAKRVYDKYGQWSLVFNSFPFVGKYLPFVAGLMKLSLPGFFFFYLVGKFACYFVLLILLS